jgi:Glycosyl transferase family 11
MTVGDELTEGIRINLIGGLGNQLHCLAAAWATAARISSPLMINAKEIPFGSNASRRYELDQFDFSKFGPGAIAITGNRLLKFNSIGLNKYFVRAKSKLRVKSPTLWGTYVDDGTPVNIQISRVTNSSIMTGHFLDFEWANHAANYGFPKELHPLSPSREFLSLREKLDYKRIAIHIRLGDYLNLKSLFPIPDEKYYLNAISRIDPIDPRYTIFTDDPVAVYKLYPNLAKDTETILDPTIDISALETMALLSYHQKIVTANSTFSSWAAWFGSNNGAKVVTPVPHLWGKWQDQLPKDWVRFNLITEAFEN